MKKDISWKWLLLSFTLLTCAFCLRLLIGAEIISKNFRELVNLAWISGFLILMLSMAIAKPSKVVNQPGISVELRAGVPKTRFTIGISELIVFSLIAVLCLLGLAIYLTWHWWF
jgi:hypothetical protein